jgi:hypothetical protein
VIGIRSLYVLVAFQLFEGPLARWVTREHATTCAWLVADAVIDHGGGLEELKATASTVAGESGCNPKAQSADGEDCGIVQQRGVARHGKTCEELKADPALALDLWVSDLMTYEAKCGSLSRALGALYGGRCGARPMLVRFRCKVAELSFTCSM